MIEWLLKHDPALRPTAQELLKSELLPPPQMEESELHEVLQHTMANVNGKAYRTMVAQLFAQNISPVTDYTYDIDLYKVRPLLEEAERLIADVQIVEQLECCKKDKDRCIKVVLNKATPAESQEYGGRNEHNCQLVLFFFFFRSRIRVSVLFNLQRMKERKNISFLFFPPSLPVDVTAGKGIAALTPTPPFLSPLPLSSDLSQMSRRPVGA